MGDTLKYGAQLHVGDYLSSSNGFFVGKLAMDGSFQVYWGSDLGRLGHMIWNTPPDPRGPGEFTMDVGDRGQVSIWRTGVTDPIWQSPLQPSESIQYFARLGGSGQFWVGTGPEPLWGSNVWYNNDGTTHFVWCDDGATVLAAQAPDAGGDSGEFSVRTKSDTDLSQRWQFMVQNDGVRFAIWHPQREAFLTAVGHALPLVFNRVALDASIWTPGGMEYPFVPPYRRAIRPAVNESQNLSVWGDGFGSGKPVSLGDWNTNPKTTSQQLWTLKPDPFNF